MSPNLNTIGKTNMADYHYYFSFERERFKGSLILSPAQDFFPYLKFNNFFKNQHVQIIL